MIIKHKIDREFTPLESLAIHRMSDNSEKNRSVILSTFTLFSVNSVKNLLHVTLNEMKSLFFLEILRLRLRMTIVGQPLYSGVSAYRGWIQ